MDRDTGETTKKAGEVVKEREPDSIKNVKTNVQFGENDQQQNKGIVNKLKSIFKF